MTASNLLRGSLRTIAAGPMTPFVPACQKIVFQYCDIWQSSEGLRSYLKYSVIDLAKSNPSVEFVVKKVPYKQPLVKGCYSTGRDKPICVRSLKPHEVAEKVQLALDSGGHKMRKLDKYPVESTTPSVRGIWSPFSDTAKPPTV